MLEYGTLVIGGSGFLGRAFTQLAGSMTCLATHHRHEQPFAPIAFDFWADDPVSLIDRYRPDSVVFAATVEYHDHDIPRTTFATVAERFVTACQNCLFIYISSDAVFDGTVGNYSESARPTPASEYGHRLALFEDLVRTICEEYCIVRPSYLFGVARGKLDHRLARTRTKLQAGETVEYFTDMYKSPVSVTETAAAICELIGQSVTGVIHCGGPRTSVYEFHCEAMRGLGLPTDCIVPARIPDDMDVPRDCSLETSRLTHLTGVQPTPVRETIESSADP